MPVRIGSRSEIRYERVRRQAELVGIKCPSCGAPNPYTQFRCAQCGRSLSKAAQAGGLRKLWIAAGLLVAVVTIVLAFVLRGH